jgi:excisionase family DNA binding protein
VLQSGIVRDKMNLTTRLPPLFTVAEAARIVRVSQRTIRAMLRDGRLRGIKPRGLDVVRTPPQALVALLGRDVLDEVVPESAPASAAAPRAAPRDPEGDPAEGRRTR